MIKAVMLVAQNYQDEEYTYPYYRMIEEGYKVDVASPEGKPVQGKYGVPAKVTKSTDDLRAEDYDLAILPGGFESPDRLRMRAEVKAFVSDMFARGKLVAAICHGPWMCISAGIMKGRKATGYISIKDDIVNAGAQYLDQDVVIDGNLITSPHYKNNGDFMRAVVDYMKAKQQAA